MHTSIVLLSLGMAVAVLTGSLSDHSELIANRNLAADRAERALAAFVDGCGSTGCNSATVNTTRHDGTVLSGCLSQTTSGTILRVKARVSWRPAVFTGLSPSTATSAVELYGLGAAAATALPPC